MKLILASALTLSAFLGSVLAAPTTPALPANFRLFILTKGDSSDWWGCTKSQQEHIQASLASTLSVIEAAEKFAAQPGAAQTPIVQQFLGSKVNLATAINTRLGLPKAAFSKTPISISAAQLPSIPTGGLLIGCPGDKISTNNPCLMISRGKDKTLWAFVNSMTTHKLHYDTMGICNIFFTTPVDIKSTSGFRSRVENAFQPNGKDFTMNSLAALILIHEAQHSNAIFGTQVIGDESPANIQLTMKLTDEQKAKNAESYAQFAGAAFLAMNGGLNIPSKVRT